jgi:hypothetical protein
MFAPSAFALGPGEYAVFVDMPPERFGVGSLADGAVEGRAWLEGAGLFWKSDGMIAEIPIPRQ